MQSREKEKEEGENGLPSLTRLSAAAGSKGGKEMQHEKCNSYRLCSLLPLALSQFSFIVQQEGKKRKGAVLKVIAFVHAKAERNLP